MKTKAAVTCAALRRGQVLYRAQKAEGKGRLDALRCLKRLLARRI